MRWMLIDRIVECQPGVSAVGVKTFPRSDLFFNDHFPGFPIVPGVLQIEMMAQMGGKCIGMSNEAIQTLLGSVKSAKFIRNINPGDRCLVKARVTKISKSYATVEGEIEVDGQRVSTASILYGIIDRSRLASTNWDPVVQEYLARQKKDGDQA